MTFWTTLRWAGTVVFLLIVLVSWLGADRNGGGSGSHDQPARVAPMIVR